MNPFIILSIFIAIGLFSGVASWLAFRRNIIGWAISTMFLFTVFSMVAIFILSAEAGR